MRAGDVIRHDGKTWRVHTATPDTTVLVSMTAYPTQRLTLPTQNPEEANHG